jgi:hypothetical protein
VGRPDPPALNACGNEPLAKPQKEAVLCPTTFGQIATSTRYAGPPCVRVVVARS